MTKIELTEEHKNKLLEMCKELFPEYDFTLEKWGHVFVTLGLKNKDLYEEHIYWFEFCMTYLVEKIIATFIVNNDGEKVYRRTLNDDLSVFYLNLLHFSRKFDNKHPVDYLYEQFKNLKND